jgi:cytochrome c oxidase subunit III
MLQTMSRDPHAFRSEPPREPSFRMSTAQLGMVFLLGSLGVLFIGSVVAYLLTRNNNPNWQHVHFGWPWGLVAATLTLTAISVSFEASLRAIRQNQQARLLRGLYGGLAFAVLFLVLQVFNWAEIKQLNPEGTAHVLALFSFYLLTGLHAAHVVGGFIPLGVVIYRTTQREYSSSRYEGVRLLTQYWHFLALVWFGLLACVVLT